MPGEQNITFDAPRDVDLRPLLRLAEQEKALSPRVKRFTVDVDPMEML